MIKPPELQTLTHGGARVAPMSLAPADRPFQAVLDQSRSHSGAFTKENELRDAAKALIASAFLIPMLASVRESSFAAGPFAQTVLERRFAPLLDQQTADQVMSGTNFALVDSIVEKLSRTDVRA